MKEFEAYEIWSGLERGGNWNGRSRAVAGSQRKQDYRRTQALEVMMGMSAESESATFFLDSSLPSIVSSPAEELACPTLCVQ